MRTVIKNTTAYLGPEFVRADGVDIIWEDARILMIGPALARPDDEIIPGGDFFVTPGLINSHFHPTQQLNRALGVGLTHQQQMDLLHATDRIKQPDDKFCLSQIAVLEALRSGTTCFYSVGSEIKTQAAAFNSMGMRAACTLIPKDIHANDKHESVRAEIWETKERLKHAEELYHRYHQGLIRVHFGACNVRYCSDELILGMLELAERYDTGYHMHAAESVEYVDAVITRTGRRAVEHLSDIGALNRRVSLAHATQLNAKEIQAISDNGCHIIHCPRANAYVGVGVCPVAELLEAGVNIALGSDAAINNNGNEVLGEAHAAFDTVSQRSGRVDLLTTEKLFSMLTINGARALGLARELGTIEPGKQADLALWSKNDPPFIPGHNYLADLIFAGSCRAHTVFVAGTKVLDNYHLAQVDEAALIKDGRAIAERYHAAFRTLGLRL